MRGVLLAAAALAAVAFGCSDGGAGDARKGQTAFRFAPIVRTDIVRTVEATGRVTPRNTAEGIPVGAQVNGKVLKLFVDYNSPVTNGQVVALIDPLVYEATYKSALAQLHVNQANVEVRKAAVSKASADLDYCTIRSPVNGVVLARKVEEGQTVVSSMNAVPVLTIAEDLKTIWIEATVPEADVGDIKVGQEVTFTADAYRQRFKGKVRQIRLAATTTNNVVTYPIIIEADNPGEKLFPGMTATLSIETARAEDAVVVSSAAFRFRPKDADRAPGELPRGRRIWLVGPDGKLVPRAVSEGVTDGSFSQIVDADDLEGAQAVAGYETPRSAAASGGDTRNPFMPKMPRRGTGGTAPEPKK